MLLAKLCLNWILWQLTLTPLFLPRGRRGGPGVCRPERSVLHQTGPGGDPAHSCSQTQGEVHSMYWTSDNWISDSWTRTTEPVAVSKCNLLVAQTYHNDKIMEVLTIGCSLLVHPQLALCTINVSVSVLWNNEGLFNLTSGTTGELRLTKLCTDSAKGKLWKGTEIATANQL